MKPYTGAELLRQFAILSLIGIGVITVALCIVTSYDLKKDLLDREWRITADYIRAEALYHLTPTDFAAPMTRRAQDRFKKFYEQATMMPEIARVKIYDVTMRIVWSDEPRLIGQRFPDNPELVSALAGRTTANLKLERKGENMHELEDIANLVEVYVPIIFPGTARVVGVVETYKLPAQVFANIRRGQLIITGTSLAGGVLLFLSLFWVVRRAARRIDSQRALTAHLQTVREEERSAIAHEAREELAQVLAALRMDLVWVAAKLPEVQSTLREKAIEILAVLDAAMDSALRIARDARPSPLDTLGLEAALDWQAQEFQARTGIRCQFTSNLCALDLDSERRTAIFRAFQETMTNIARHASASRVVVNLKAEAKSVVLTVEDDGKGFAKREIAEANPLGLLGVRECVHRLEGTVGIVGVPGRGTTLTVTIPLHRAARAPLPQPS
jgi:signal transduction histidine kinase